LDFSSKLQACCEIKSVAFDAFADVEVVNPERAEIDVGVLPRKCHRWEPEKARFAAGLLELLGETHAKDLTLETVFGSELAKVMEISKPRSTARALYQADRRWREPDRGQSPQP
jgi:hypothetical protein